ncbi:MAG TPA: glycosyltransferase family 2 protein [Gemmataceae bacterium]|nr:glycosyltransferase family 2 protein [Gemmataceae bacterium]
MPRSKVEVGDRFVWKAIRDAKLSRTHLDRLTVNYRTRHQAHYRHVGKQPPPGIKHIHFPAPTAPGLKQAKARQQRVSLCMIVRNEATKLETCLRSVAGLVHEMIVVGIGSTDCTKEVASRCGAKVFDFPCIDDFAAARNESLLHATGDRILWLDADESFDEPNRQRLGKLFAMLRDENRVYMMKQWSAPDHANGSVLVVDQARLFRRLPAFAWRHRIHEQILLSLREKGAKPVWTDIRIRHVGYQDAAMRKQKLSRNLRLLQME